jgi:hypothetical protein
MRGGLRAGEVMGFFSPEGEHHVESIVFFLSEALRGAIETGDRLQHSACDLPQFAPGMECSAMLDRLAGFRGQTTQLSNLELLMLTKILRAGELAKELRPFEPELRPEIDTFRLATVMAADLRDMLMPDADRSFNGSVPPKRFLESRGYLEGDGTTRSEVASGYMVAGHVDVRLLIDACEALHFSLAGRYGFNASPLVFASAEETTTLSDRAEEEPFLLSELGEIVVESPMPFADRRPAETVVRH